MQSVRDGRLRIVEFPTPSPGPTEVLVATRRSLISSGTESAVRALASASLLQKAKARPDLVRQVLNKTKSDGIKDTMKAVRTKLDDDMPLGYSAMGLAVAVGEAVDGIHPGDRVATASAGHGDYQLVPGLLCAKVPDGVDDESAAFATVGAIALHGLRQADVGIDSSVAVIGLGLVGQLTVRLALASGLRVVGIDLQQDLVDRAAASGASAFIESGPDTTRTILDFTDGMGIDAALITAATSLSEPVARATEILRDRGRIVVVGDVGLDLDRRPFYEKELDLRFARSYGPGRYDRSYEELGIDYPTGYVRWTEGRNLQAVLSLIERGRVRVDDLVAKTYTLEDAERAYAALGKGKPVLGVQFDYRTAPDGDGAPLDSDEPSPSESQLPHLSTGPPRDLSSGIIGAGQYAKATLLPALRAAGWPRPVAVTSASGLSARTLADRNQIPTVHSSADSLLEDSSISVVFVLSRHDSHADLAEKALRAGKHVFLEKPLALTQDEFERVIAAQQAANRVLWVGFNRRYSAAVQQVKAVLGHAGGPLVATYRVNAGRLPDSHWYRDRRQGGRLLGEVCHFVDTVSAVMGSQPHQVVALGDRRGEALLQENLTLALQYANGSTAAITYSAEGSPRTPKERLEIMGRSHTIVIDDFQKLSVDGRTRSMGTADKGHAANVAAFASAITAGIAESDDYLLSLNTTNAMFAAVKSLLEGGVRVPISELYFPK